MTAGAADIDRVARKFVALGANIAPESVIPANETAPAPQGLYATVLRLAEDRPGTADDRYEVSGDMVTATSTTWPSASFSVQFFRDGAMQAASRLQQWLLSPLGIEQGLAHHVNAGTEGGIQRLDSLVQEAPEERTVMTMTIDSVTSLVQNLGRIRAVPLETALGAATQTDTVTDS